MVFYFRVTVHLCKDNIKKLQDNLSQEKKAGYMQYCIDKCVTYVYHQSTFQSFTSLSLSKSNGLNGRKCCDRNT